ncbi:MAG TPA: DUF1292 domain-containing protein [Ruminococcus sp.]|nr:DUF1292 domain-containing protein [Ruminococcus sp.]
MSDMNKEPEELEENENYITLTDDDGQDISFEVLDTIEYKDRLFAVLLPFEDEDDEVVILEIIPGEDPEMDDFVTVDDEALLNEVFEEFQKRGDEE